MNDYQITFEIEGLPSLTNQKRKLGHWSKLHKEAAFWKQLVYYKVVRMRPKAALQRAKLKLIRHSATEPDFEGLVSGFKHVIDGLIEAQVIVNDRMENIGQPEYHWVKAKPSEGKITVTVTAVPDPQERH